MTFSWLPRATTIAALFAVGFTFLVFARFDTTLFPIVRYIVIGGAGVAALLIVLAPNPDTPRSYLYWLSAGLWAGIAYLNPQIIGLIFFVVALLAVGSALAIERARGGFTLNGPLVFVFTLVAIVIAGNYFGR